MLSLEAYITYSHMWRAGLVNGVHIITTTRAQLLLRWTPHVAQLE